MLKLRHFIVEIFTSELYRAGKSVVEVSKAAHDMEEKQRVS